MYSVLKAKCPRCHEGNLFVVSNPWNLKKTLQMPPACMVCKQDFRIEYGFYSGALWTSYPIVVFIDLLILSTIFWFPQYIAAICATMLIVSLLLQPWIMRLGRAIWINIFVRYDPNVPKVDPMKSKSDLPRSAE